MSLVNARAVALSTLTRITASGGAFNGAKVGLFKNNINPTPNTVLADLEPCDFDGYSLGSAVTWGTAYYPTGDAAAIPAGMQQFIATGNTTPNNVYGVYIVNGAGDTLLVSERLAEAIPIVDAGDGVALFAQLVMPNDIFV